MELRASNFLISYVLAELSEELTVPIKASSRTIGARYFDPKPNAEIVNLISP
jgi:hypothetical protein